MALVQSLGEARPAPNSTEMTGEEPEALGEIGGNLIAMVFKNPTEATFGVVFLCTLLSLVLMTRNAEPGRTGLWLTVVIPIGFFIMITFSLQALNIFYSLGAPYFLLVNT